jgi:hypothetical protein
MSGYESPDRSAIAFAPSRELTAGGFLDYAAFCASLSRHRLSACARAPFKQSAVLKPPVSRNPLWSRRATPTCHDKWHRNRIVHVENSLIQSFGRIARRRRRAGGRAGRYSYSQHYTFSEAPVVNCNSIHHSALYTLVIITR